MTRREFRPGRVYGDTTEPTPNHQLSHKSYYFFKHTKVQIPNSKHEILNNFQITNLQCSKHNWDIETILYLTNNHLTKKGRFYAQSLG